MSSQLIDEAVCEALKAMAFQPGDYGFELHTKKAAALLNEHIDTEVIRILLEKAKNERPSQSV